MSVKPWSISTTIRNPLRIRDFLIILNKLKGDINNAETQKLFQIYLIQDKKYKPTNLKSEWEKIFNDPNKNFSFKIAKKIFEYQNYIDPAMRGRTSMSPLKEYGFVFVDEESKIQISNFGKAFIQSEYDLEEIFLQAFIKWQYPNPLNDSFNIKDGFNIKPFIATLHLIKLVNELSISNNINPVGLSKDEFDLFAPTLINYADIKKYADKIIKYRLETKKLSKIDLIRFKKDYKIDFVKQFFNTDKLPNIEKLINNLKDYGDNIRRYFRLTKLLYFRGNGYYIDIEFRRQKEIDSLLKKYSGKADSFDNRKDYLDYIVKNIELPWDNRKHLQEIASNIEKDLKITDFKKDISKLNKTELKKYISYLRQVRIEIHEKEKHIEAQEIKSIDEYIDQLQNIYNSNKKFSIELERLSTMSLNAINDAIKIKPNYPIGDDGEPTFTAPANIPDIECYYDDFCLICEATMLKSRDQWFNEGQPVMRHLKDFENKNSKNSYCLFVAPAIHSDTANTYYIANKYGYDGKQQKIIPITINQLAKILKVVKQYRLNNKNFNNQLFRELLDNVVSNCISNNSFSDWIKNIDVEVKKWKEEKLIGIQ
ncbi:MAG: AlwI family type II restriction endonuclease [Endomicrobium sp.]|jgi:hypothetical protein|nr:AlwI family type II restriction endonuclease [Endomicrobium sp.]